MAKRYHHMSEGSYAGKENRREIESRDFHMISEDKSAIANLPQDVMIKKYPDPDDYGHYDLNDTIVGIDHQRKKDSEKKKKGPFPDMY
jgi:hypothetical protein